MSGKKKLKKTVMHACDGVEGTMATSKVKLKIDNQELPGI